MTDKDEASERQISLELDKELAIEYKSIVYCEINNSIAILK